MPDARSSDPDVASAVFYKSRNGWCKQTTFYTGCDLVCERRHALYGGKQALRPSLRLTNHIAPLLSKRILRIIPPPRLSGSSVECVYKRELPVLGLNTSAPAVPFTQSSPVGDSQRRESRSLLQPYRIKCDTIDCCRCTCKKRFFVDDADSRSCS